VGSGVFFVILNDNTNNVILNAVKNLSVRVGGRAIVDCRAIPENLLKKEGCSTIVEQPFYYAPSS
jgi:hypothetical protein